MTKNAGLLFPRTLVPQFGEKAISNRIRQDSCELPQSIVEIHRHRLRKRDFFSFLRIHSIAVLKLLIASLPPGQTSFKPF